MRSDLVLHGNNSKYVNEKNLRTSNNCIKMAELK
jgi:hypothetical protein